MSATNAFSVGSDLSLDIVDPVLGPLRFPIKTGWKVKPAYTKLKSKGLDGNIRHAALPDGWTLGAMLDRASGAVDTYFANAEANYFAGAASPNVSVTETIRELDGSVSEFNYPNACMSLADGGDWKADAKVEQSIDIEVGRRIKVQ